MKIIYPLLGLLLLSPSLRAEGLSPSESVCLARLRSESDFIVSRINLIHRGYEKKLRNSGLEQFSSGDYSTTELLDSTIRKYRRKLIRKIRNYPVKYASRLRGTQHEDGSVCMAGQLDIHAIGIIHEFDLRWQQTLAKARSNADYFRRMAGIR